MRNYKSTSESARSLSWFKPIRFVAALLLTFLLTSITSAQNGASISGRVTDPNGAAVVGAEVRLSARSGIQLFGRTNDKGVYGFTGLGPGEFILEISARGFSTATSETVTVDRSQTATKDFQLAVEAVNENVVVIASGTPQRPDEVSKAVTILQDKDIETKREITVAEALRGTPGVRVQQQGSPGSLVGLRFRGLKNSDTAILLDGLRVRDASDASGSAQPFYSDLLPVGLNRMEILRGSGSSIYGTNAIGGVINLVPTTGADKPRFDASFEGGSMALFRERIQGSGGIGKRAGFSFGLTRLDVRDGVDGNDQYGNTAGGARFQFDVTPSINIAGNFYGTISNAIVNNSPFPLPAAFTSTEEFPRAIAGTTFQPDFNNPDSGRRNLLLVGSVRMSQRVNEMLSYSVAYQHVTARRKNYDGPAVDPRFAAFVSFGDFEFLSTNHASTDTVDARAYIRAGRSNLITAGVEFEREQLFQQFLSAFGGGDGTTDRQKTFAVFGQDQIVALDGRLQFSFGVRGQFYRISAADRPDFLSAVEPKSSITGDGSVAYFVRSTGTKLRAHVGNGFRAPSLFERFGQGTFANAGFTRFGDPTIRAEQSIGIDGGFDQSLSNDRLVFGATYFYTRLQRVIAFTSFANDPLGLQRFGGYVNRPGGVARGIESYLEATPFRGSNLRASYTYTNSDRFVEGSGLAPEYVIPNHLFGLNFNQRYRAWLFSFDLGYTGDYIAPVFETNFPFRTANLTFDGYTKADLFVTYERPLSERVLLILFGGAENIFSVEYFENGYLAPGTVGRGGVKVQF
jgi:iron complex outermembrane receptor protein